MKRLFVTRISLLAAFGLLFFSPSAFGDGISIQHLALPDLIDASRVALLVRVDAYDPKTRVMKAKVKRVWSRDKAIVKSLSKQVSFVLPQPQKMIRGRWLVVRRYWDALSPGTVFTPKQELVLIPSFGGIEAPINTVIKASPQLTNKLRLLFRGNWKVVYGKKATIASLVRDLADFDLYQQAYAVLKTRRRLRDVDVIRGAPKPRHHNLVDYHLKQLPKGRKPAFLSQIVSQLKKRANPRLQRLLVNHFTGEALRSEELGVLSTFLKVALQRATKADIEMMYSLNNPLLRHLEASKSSRAAGQFVAYFAGYTRLRLPYGGSDEHITKFVKMLTKKRRAAFCLALMGELSPARDGKFDHLGFTVILDNQDLVPAACMIRFLKWVQPRIDPDASDGCQQVVAMVKTIVRLAHRHPARIKQLGPLAQAVHSQYRCNVDAALKNRLAEIGWL